MALKELYATHLAKLLPQGKAWPTLTTDASSKLHQLLQGMAGELASSHIRFEKLLDEADPRTTLELLPEWETLAGLPDECSRLGDSIQKRRENLVFKLTGIQGQSIPAFETLFERLRVKATVKEIRPFVCGLSKLGQDALNGGATNRRYFTVEVLEKRVTWFTCGLSELGVTPFASIDHAEELECFVRRFKPAHTEAIIGYR